MHQSGGKHSTEAVNCKNCHGKLGVVSKICGFEDLTLNFSSKHVALFASIYDTQSINQNLRTKWAEVKDKVYQSESMKNYISRLKVIKISNSVPQIKGNFASNSSQLVGSNTMHFRGTTDFQSILNPGKAVELKSNLTPKDSQWRSFFFSCVNNTLLCLPTGFGKTLIAQMLMKAYRDLNPKQIQVFVVPTIVLVQQQSVSIEMNTGLKVQQRSGEHGDHVPWKSDEIAVCTPAMLLQAFEFGEILMSQLCLLVLDEAHEAINSNSNYGKLANKLKECLPHQRPRILALTASPSGTNNLDVNTTVESLCKKLFAKPFIPPRYKDEFKQKINCNFIEIKKNIFEVEYEKFVFQIFRKLGELDNYFNCYNLNYHENIPTQTKVNEALNVISQTKTMSLQEHKHKLLEIAMFMKKWIDSLDFLRIFGPQKLLIDIRKDLKSPQTIQKILDIDANHIFQLIDSELTRLESFMLFCPNSSRVEQLMKEIEKYRDTKTRILVFVQRRFTAERLCRSLQEHEITKSMNPDYVIGNSEGDFPKELQEEKLKKFKSGKCQILVCTSVLEQGVDVASCGLVICFDGINSLKSIIQSRGRARQTIANYVVFVSPNHVSKMNQLSNLEQTVEYVVKNLMTKYDSTFEESYESEINDYLNGKYDEDSLPKTPEELSEDEEISEDEDENLISLKFFDYSNGQGVIDILSETISSRKFRFKVLKKQITANFTINPNENVCEKVSELIRKFSKKAVERKVSTWIQNQTIETPDDSGNFEECNLQFDKLNGYYFEDSTTTFFDENSIWVGQIQMTIKKSYIKLKHGHYTITIEREYLDNVILINETETILELYLTLRSPPIFQVNEASYPVDFTKTSFNICLTRFFPCESMQKLLNALSNFTIEFFHIVNLKQKLVSYDSNTVAGDFKKTLLIKQWHSKNASVLPPILPQKLVDQLLSIKSNQLLEMILQNTTPMRFKKLQFSDFQVNYELPLDEFPRLKNYVKIGRVRVTPARLIFLPFTEIPQNRIFRYFPNEENFIIVEFSGEQDRFPWKSQYVADHFLKVLQEGFEICGKSYKFSTLR